MRRCTASTGRAPCPYWTSSYPDVCYHHGRERDGQLSLNEATTPYPEEWRQDQIIKLRDQQRWDRIPEQRPQEFREQSTLPFIEEWNTRRTPEPPGGPSQVFLTAIGRLTERQFDIAKAIASGGSNADVARTFGMAESSVRGHVKAIAARLQDLEPVALPKGPRPVSTTGGTRRLVTFDRDRAEKDVPSYPLDAGPVKAYRVDVEAAAAAGLWPPANIEQARDAYMRFPVGPVTTMPAYTAEDMSKIRMKDGSIGLPQTSWRQLPTSTLDRFMEKWAQYGFTGRGYNEWRPKTRPPTLHWQDAEHAIAMRSWRPDDRDEPVVTDFWSRLSFPRPPEGGWEPLQVHVIYEGEHREWVGAVARSLMEDSEPLTTGHVGRAQLRSVSKARWVPDGLAEVLKALAVCATVTVRRTG